jgi:uncharacterized repeat protein (TIGR01451 family)
LRRKLLIVVAVLATAFAMAVPAVGAQQSQLTATPLTADSTFTGSANKSGETVRVIVQLAAEPIASYEGGVAGIPATSPAVTKKDLNANSKPAKDYKNYLKKSQSDFVERLKTVAPDAKVDGDFQVAVNGVSMTVDSGELANISRLPGVVAVLPDRLEQPQTEVSPQFIGAPIAWSQLGGQANAGEGVIVGVLDSGIWPEHPSVADPSPVGGAYPTPPTVPGSNGFGSGGTKDTCDFGNTSYNSDDAPFSCNNKLIGAYDFTDTYKLAIGLIPSEFDSARDSNGHGTHTMTTAAGNGGVSATLLGVSRGILSGVAPRAHVIAYKVCGYEGCFSSDSVHAVEQAILDGVDVINFSISGGGSPYGDAVSLAFLGAYDAGIVVSASAGNSGPGADTTDHREPWTMTVGASTSNRHFLSTVSLTDGTNNLELVGATVTNGIGTPTPVVSAADYGDALCNSPFAPATFAGQIVICERGVIARVEKSFNVAAGGAGGMLLYNPTLQGLATDNHFIPSVHLENDAGDELLDFMDNATGPVTATFTGGVATTVQGDVMAAFSSRGGPGQTLGISKPDVTAPGVQILAGNTPLPETVEGGPPSELFQAIQGTSMSSPHNAGAAALVKAIHPNWTPGQIKSALMTTSLVSGVTKEDGSTAADAFDMGSGRIDLTKAGSAELTFDESAGAYLALEDNLWNANYPSLFIPSMPGLMTVQRTVHNELSTGGSWKTSVQAPADLVVSVPKNINVSKNGYQTFEITVDARAVPIGETRMARMTLSRNGGQTLTFPITIVRGEPVVGASKECAPGTIGKNQTTTCTITVSNTAFGDAQVQVIDQLPSELTLINNSVTGAQKSGNGIAFNGTLFGAEPPSPSVVDGTGTTPAGGYLPLSAFGLTPISGVGDETITNFTVPAFVYAGDTYSRIGMVSNGYAVVGGGTGGDVDFVNQVLPDPTPPNNVLAPFWTDLNAAAGGAMRIGVLTDTGSGDSWLILDWAGVPEYSSTTPATFEIWIGINGTEDISYTYGSVGSGDGGFLTVGAENAFGNAGDNWYVDGTGTPVASGDELRVVGVPGAPGETHVITFQAKGAKPGQYTNYALVTSDAFEGTSVISFSGEVKK